MQIITLRGCANAIDFRSVEGRLFSGFGTTRRWGLDNRVAAAL